MEPAERILRSGSTLRKTSNERGRGTLLEMEEVALSEHWDRTPSWWGRETGVHCCQVCSVSRWISLRMRRCSSLYRTPSGQLARQTEFPPRCHSKFECSRPSSAIINKQVRLHWWNFNFNYTGVIENDNMRWREFWWLNCPSWVRLPRSRENHIKW